MNFGTAEAFQLTFPMEVDFDSLNPDLFTKYKEKTGHEEQLSEHIWIFSRGNGETKMKDRFFWAKIDLLIFAFSKWVYSWFGTIEKTNQIDIPKKGIVLKRKPLQTPTLFDLFRETEVVEPTYKEVFVVYRRKDEAINKNEIYIKQFEDIPMADVELVYPSIKLGYRPIDIIWLTISFILGVFGFFCEVTGYNIFGGNEEEIQPWTWSYTTIISIASFVFCAFQFYQSYTNFGEEYRNLMTNLVSQKGSNGRGSMLQLSERAKYQDLKESVSCYYFLLKHGKMHKDKLKQMVDEYINTRQKQWVTNFDIMDSLGKVLDMGVVIHDKDQPDHYYALPIKEALVKVKDYYHYLCDNDIKPFDWESK